SCAQHEADLFLCNIIDQFHLSQTYRQYETHSTAGILLVAAHHRQQFLDRPGPRHCRKAKRLQQSHLSLRDLVRDEGTQLSEARGTNHTGGDGLAMEPGAVS